MLKKNYRAERCDKYRLGKLLLGKLHIWEVATWENAFGKAPNVKFFDLVSICDKS